jgi:hypothetical protein
VTAEIPFDFHVGKSALPAGSYTVTLDNFRGILQLHNDDTKDGILLAAQGHETGKDDPRLTFRCYSGDCFLSAIWIPGNPGISLSKTSREKEIERGGAQVAMAYVPLATR